MRALQLEEHEVREQEAQERTGRVLAVRGEARVQVPGELEREFPALAG